MAGQVRGEAAGEPSGREATSSGYACVAMLARIHGVDADPVRLAHQSGDASGTTTAGALVLAARSVGLKARAAQASLGRLATLPLPVIAKAADGGFFVLAGFSSSIDASAPASTGRVLLHDPRAGRPEVIDIDELKKRWTGEVVLVASRASVAADLARFDFTWFIPAIVKYRRLLTEVLVASLFIQLFALLTPLFFQVVMDKVLVHKGFSTLTVIGVAMLAVALFETVSPGFAPTSSPTPPVESTSSSAPGSSGTCCNCRSPTSNRAG